MVCHFEDDPTMWAPVASAATLKGTTAIMPPFDLERSDAIRNVPRMSVTRPKPNNARTRLSSETMGEI